MKISRSEAARRFRNRIKALKWESYDGEMGRCQISKRTIELFTQADWPRDKRILAIAEQANVAWNSGLMWMDIGQREMFVGPHSAPGRELLPIFVAWDGEMVYVDSEQFLPFE